MDSITISWKHVIALGLLVIHDEIKWTYFLLAKNRHLAFVMSAIVSQIVVHGKMVPWNATQIKGQILYHSIEIHKVLSKIRALRNPTPRKSAIFSLVKSVIEPRKSSSHHIYWIKSREMVFYTLGNTALGNLRTSAFYLDKTLPLYKT